MLANWSATQLDILRAAERLFAEEGIDNVSLAAINRAAGQRNRSATQYHFGSLDSVIEAVLERHSAPIQERWMGMLDGLELQGELTLRSLMHVLVRPIVAKLDDPDGGVHYIVFAAQLVNHPRFPLIERAVSGTPGAARLSYLVALHTQIPGPILLFRMARVSSLLYCGLAEYLRMIRRGILSDDQRELFVEDLIDALIATLSAPPSPATQLLIDAHG